MNSYTALREAKEQEDYRSRADGSYLPRHGETEHAERPGKTFALPVSAAAGRRSRDRTQPAPTGGRHQGARARRLRRWRRGSHGVSGREREGNRC